MTLQDQGLSERLRLLKSLFADTYDETLARDYLVDRSRYAGLPKLGAGAVFEARLLPSGLVLKVAHDGFENDEIYKRKWLAAMASMQPMGGELLGWPIYRMLCHEKLIGVVTLALKPGLHDVGPESGDIAAVQSGLVQALGERRMRLTDHWQWGTRAGLPFIMDLSDLDFG